MTKDESYTSIKRYLLDNASAVTKLATKHHRDYLGDFVLRTEILPRYLDFDISIINLVAEHIGNRSTQTSLFKTEGHRIALSCIEDGLTLAESHNGYVFLKQAVWELLVKNKLLESLSEKDSFALYQEIGTYCDVLSSELTFTYHTFYTKKLEEANTALQHNLSYIESIVDTVKEPLIVLSNDLRIKLASQSFLSTFKVLPKDIENKLVYELGNKQWDIPSLRTLLEATLTKDSPVKDYLVEHNFPEIGYKSFLLNSRRIPGINHEPDDILLSFEDITQQKESLEEVRREAFHDPLTALPNRKLFESNLVAEINRAQRKTLSIAVAILDLDDFKKINDDLGHLAGDSVLKEIAARLSRATREEDTVARFGGDEFTILLTDVTDTESVYKSAHQILETLTLPLTIETHTVNIQASLGVALFPQHGEDFKHLLKNADTALYEAKKSGKHTFKLFGNNTPELTSDT